MKKTQKDDILLCECDSVHSELVGRSKERMPSTERLYELSDFFKVFGDSTRISILFAIDGEPMCVCDIAALLGMTKSAVSHQMKILRGAGLVTYRKSGKNVFYALADDHVREIIEKALEHVQE